VALREIYGLQVGSSRGAPPAAEEERQDERAQEIQVYQLLYRLLSDHRPVIALIDREVAP
jgi:hypothetical protein